MPRNKAGKFVKKTIAQKVRDLNEKGLSRVEIAKTLGIRYQRVRNVLVPRVIAETEVEGTEPEADAELVEVEPQEAELVEA